MTLENTQPVRSEPLQQSSPRWRPVIIGTLVGGLLAVAWSYRLVDDVIGQTLAREMLGREADEMPLTNTLGAMSFALATGIAGSFTACNVAAFCALSPMTTQGLDGRGRVQAAARTMGSVAVGAMTTAGLYGAIGAWFGPEIPQLSTSVIGDGFPVRLLQSAVVFGFLGLIMLAVAILIISSRRPAALTRLAHSRWALVGIGGLIGMFLIGRPFPMFMQLFRYAAETHNPFVGAVTFALQALGNIFFIFAVLTLVLWLAGDRLGRWLTAAPGRLARLSAGTFAAAGAFLFLYWAVRVPALFGYGFFPRMPWNG